MEDIAPIIGVALAPLAYFIICKLMLCVRWFFNFILPEGKVKQFLMKEY